jgi:protein-disulfide isomerase
MSTPRPRRASPRTLAVAGGIAAIVVVGIILAVTLGTGSGSGTSASATPTIGSAAWKGALPDAPIVRKLFAGIPERGLVLGSPTAPVTLTEFVDLQCPLCRDFETTDLPTIVRRYVRPGKLDIRLEPWSILSAPDSPRGQAATIAAAHQNKGFQFAELLYLNQGREDSGWLTNGVVRRAAASIDGMTVSRLLGETRSPAVKSAVKQIDHTASGDLFNATPTILLNRRGQPAQVVAIGIPDLATLESQIASASEK